MNGRRIAHSARPRLKISRPGSALIVSGSGGKMPGTLRFTIRGPMIYSIYIASRFMQTSSSCLSPVDFDKCWGRRAQAMINSAGVMYLYSDRVQMCDVLCGNLAVSCLLV